MLKLTAQTAGAGIVGTNFSFAATPGIARFDGLVAGEPTAAEIGNRVLKQGGNAVDAIVAAALAATVAAPHVCGIGGYGGHMTLALEGGKKITAIDFNGAAPAAAHAAMFPLDEHGTVEGKANELGWMATGVPGTLAGLQLALDRFGTRHFRDVVEPAVQLAREGVIVSPGLSDAIRAARAPLQVNPASAKFLLVNDQPRRPGERIRNLELARLLDTLARRNSVESFYRGDIAAQIAEAFQRHGGLVTTQDLRAYQAREVEPLRFSWHGTTLCTAPLTAAGLTVIEALAILKDVNWNALPVGPERTFIRVEALRLALADRWQLLGDPSHTKVPIPRLLSQEYAHSQATKVMAALREQKPIASQIQPRPHSGGLHLNSIDRHGNVVSLSLTHGNPFGACVTVDGLGLMLGHGMSRFEPRPGHPNAPGPGKRPLNNLCPSILLREGAPILALGATGGSSIPSGMFDFLTHFMGSNESAAEAINAPRMHTEGNVSLTVEPRWGAADQGFLKHVGYSVQAGTPGVIQAISCDPKAGATRAFGR